MISPDGPRTARAVLEQVVRRVHAEYIEMPGLQLTLRQAQRLFGLTTMECAAALDWLTEIGVLARRPDGRYARHTGEGRRQPLAEPTIASPSPESATAA